MSINDIKARLELPGKKDDPNNWAGHLIGAILYKLESDFRVQPEVSTSGSRIGWRLYQDEDQKRLDDT